MKKQTIIIIGGGIGGLMTAIALNKKGIASTIYEKTKSFEVNGAGLGLWANATKILDEFGLLSNLLVQGNVLNELRTSTSNGKSLNVVNLKKLEDKFHFPSIVLLRKDLQKELFNTLPSSQILFNKQCIKIENKTTEIIVHFSDGTLEVANVIIFADGVHSIARKDIFNFPSLKYAGRTSWRGVAQFDKSIFANNINYEIFGKGRRIGIFPLPGNLAYWYAAVNMSEEEALKQKRTTDCVLSHFKDWAEPVNTLIKNTLEERLILTNINYDPHINKMVKGNIVLLGDAAHPITPDVGQGACQAIEDAYVLAECLSQNKTIAEGLNSYENKRLPRVKSISETSFRTGKIRQVESMLGMTIRNSLFRILPESVILKMLERNLNNER